MARVIHQPQRDGQVERVEIYDDGGNSYVDTLANFATDYGQAFPALYSDGSPLFTAIGREYAIGEYHVVYDADSVVVHLDNPWTEGDAILAALTTIIVAKEARLAPPALTLPEAKLAAKKKIDNAAGRARARYITTVGGQEAVYLTKYDEAVAYKAAGYPAIGSPNEYLHLTSEANATGQTAQQVADLVLATREAWYLLSAQIEGERLGGKKNVDDAVDEAGVDTARDNAITTLDAI